jgi:diaminopimelate epimerase
VIDAHTIAIEIWERGAGYTQASGSSSCAAALAAIQRGGCASPVTVQMPGGELTVDISSDADGWHVALTGPVTPVFVGHWDSSFAPPVPNP